MASSAVQIPFYDRVEALFFENPTFGFYFPKLTSARLFENIGRLAGDLQQRAEELVPLQERFARYEPAPAAAD